MELLQSWKKPAALYVALQETSVGTKTHGRQSVCSIQCSCPPYVSLLSVTILGTHVGKHESVPRSIRRGRSCLNVVLKFEEETSKMLHLEGAWFCVVLKLGRFGQQIGNTWKVLKCGAGEGWRSSVRPIMWEMKKCYLESMSRGISYMK